jgi:hypothetical protein
MVKMVKGMGANIEQKKCLDLKKRIKISQK